MMLIQEEIQKLVDIGFNKYEIGMKLMEKQIPDEQIIEGINQYPFLKTRQANYYGSIFVVVALILFYLIGGSHFTFVFSSSGIFTRDNIYQFNEFVLIPTLASSLLITGICLLIDKSNINKSIRKGLRILIIATIIGSIVAFELVIIFLCMIAFIFFILVNLPGSKQSEGERIVSGIRNKESFKQILYDVNLKAWNGSWLFIIVMSLPFMLLQFPFHTDFTGILLVVFVFVNKIIFVGSIFVAVLMYIDYLRFRWWFAGLSLLAIIQILVLVLTSHISLSIVVFVVLLSSGSLVYFKGFKKRI